MYAIYISIWRCQIFTYYPIVPHCALFLSLYKLTEQVLYETNQCKILEKLFSTVYFTKDVINNFVISITQLDGYFRDPTILLV